ncbi:MAG: alpha/beta fold hydrolase [Solirubrobacterales bacterium]|nr:alpha/beta fold hydrolase [Solirubrobacterales bacterium]
MSIAAYGPVVEFDRRGAGSPLVLIHPLGADRSVWAPVLDRLAARHDVIVPDLPGFGASPALDGPATPAALAASMTGLLDELGLPAVHAVGNSLGGWVALELGLGGRADRVTAIAPAGLWEHPLAPRRGIARRLASLALPLIPSLTRSERGRRLLLGGSVAHPERVPAHAAEQLVRSYATAPGLRAANERMRGSRFARLAEITVPVTLAWPDHDRLVAPPRRLPPNVRSVVLHGCGHIPMWDDPEQVAALIEGG